MHSLLGALPALLAVLLIASPAFGQSPKARRTVAWTAASTAEPQICQAQVKVDGKPVQTTRCHGRNDEMILLVVLDLSGDLTLITEAREALARELDKLPANVWLSVMTAQDGLQVLSDPGNDRAETVSTIRRAKITGAAGLLDSLEPAARLATAVVHKSGVRMAALFISDSNIYNYREDYTNPVINYSDSRDLSRRFPDALIREKASKLAASLAGFDVPMSIVHLAYLRDRLNEAYQVGLRQIAEATGGSANFCRSQAEIATEISATVARLVSHHAIDFEVPESAPPQFTIELTVPGSTAEYRTRFARRSK